MKRLYMLRDCNNVYYGPYEEDRARREATERATSTQADVQIMPLGQPELVAKWKGVVMQEMPQRGGPYDR